MRITAEIVLCSSPSLPPYHRSTVSLTKVRRLCELGEAGTEARLVLLDIPDNG